MKFHFKGVLQNTGWLANAAVTTDGRGLVVSVEQNATAVGEGQTVDGYCLPGFQNAHSHSFQYAMAGLAEKHDVANNSSDFWSWREAMYKLAVRLTPGQLESIAAMVYAEMVRHGYTNVAEFHYLHHDISGHPYMNLAEMSGRLISAAQKAGINITLLPVFYQKGGFGKPPAESQRRFITSDIDRYAKLFEASAEACNSYDNSNIGIAIHSMRGVDPDAIKLAASDLPGDIPFHIHIAEQIQEVEDSVSHLGKRPVEWMLENVDLDERFHFVHATHSNESEIYGLVNAMVNVVLCPTTEGNLGDGLFPLRSFQQIGGRWSIGTDSHVSLNPLEELRLLDYGQRLFTNKRDTFAVEDGNSGAYAIKQAVLTGRRAMNNFETEYFKVGEPFNASVISAGHPLIQTASPENILNTIVYSVDQTFQKGTIVNGEWKSIDGRHIHQDEIVRSFLSAMKETGLR